MKRQIVFLAFAFLLCSVRLSADLCYYDCHEDMQWDCYYGEVAKRPDFDTPRFDVKMDGSPESAVADMQWAHSFWRSSCQGNTGPLPWCSVVWESAVSDTPDLFDGYNTVAWIDDQQLWTDLYSGEEHYQTAGAFTQYNWYEGSCLIADTDTRFNGWKYSWGEGSLPNTADIRTWMLHEAGHQLGLAVTEDYFRCSDCQMYYNVGLGGPDDWDILYGDRVAYCTLYSSTGIGDLYLFTATPSDGRVLLEWSVVPASGPHDFRLYASEDGAPFVLIHEEESGIYEEDFSWWDEDVRNGHEYEYAIWCDDGFGPTPSCTPSGVADPLAEYDQLAVSEEESGLRLSWVTSYEAGGLNGYDVYASSSDGFIDDLVKLNTSLIPAEGQMTEYDYLDSEASHGWPRYYLLVAVGSGVQERCGPLANPCCKPYPANCELAFLGSPPACAVLCPSGDVQQQGGAAPIELEVVIRDSCGYPIEGYEDIVAVLEPMGDVAIFRLCCAIQQPAVLGPLAARPVDPTDANGRTSISLYWGGGASDSLRLSVGVGGGAMLPDAVSVAVRSVDLNADCEVDPLDFMMFASHFGTSEWQSDFDCDGTVGPLDFGIFSSHFGHDCVGGETRPIPPELLPALTTGVEQLPVSFSLQPNTPNPFNPATTISYSVPDGGSPIALTVYNLAGKLVRTLVDDEVSAGFHTVTWDGTDDRGRHVPSGVYFYKIDAPGFAEHKRMVLLK